MSVTLAGIAAKFTAMKGSDLVKNLTEAVDTFVDTKGEKAERDLKIQEMVQNYNLELLKEANASDKMHLEDTQNARDNNTKIQESDKSSCLAKYFAYLMDGFLTLLFGTVTVILFLKLFKVADIEVDMVSLMALHGTVTAVFMTVVNFHRGTSIGSKVNGDALRKQLNK
jgi:hypothetical protein